MRTLIGGGVAVDAFSGASVEDTDIEFELPRLAIDKTAMVIVGQSLDHSIDVMASALVDLRSGVSWKQWVIVNLGFGLEASLAPSGHEIVWIFKATINNEVACTGGFRIHGWFHAYGGRRAGLGCGGGRVI